MRRLARASFVGALALLCAASFGCNDRAIGSGEDDAGEGGTSGERGESEGEGDAGEDPECGNGVVEAGETCDDGNLEDFDGCNADCRETAGVEWEHPPFGTPGPCDDYLGVAHSGAQRFAVVGALGRAEGPLANCQIMIKVFEAAGELAWERTVDPGPNCDEAWGVDFDAGGNLWVGGHSYDPERLNDHWIAKYDGAGEQLWAQTFDEGGEDYGYALEIDAQGRAIFVGASQLPGKGFDVAIRALDGEGQQLWAQFHDQAGASDFGLDLTTHSDHIWVGGFVGVPGQDENAWVAAFDPGGALLWSHVHDGPISDQDRVGGIARAANGDIVVAGFETSQTNQDIWVRRLDGAGNELWTRTYDDPLSSADRAQELDIDDQGDIVVVGQHYTLGEGGGSDSFDTWMRKYDASGEVLWTRAGLDEDRLDLWYAVDAHAGSIYVAGGLSLAPGDCTDAVVRRYSP